LVVWWSRCPRHMHELTLRVCTKRGPVNVSRRRRLLGALSAATGAGGCCTATCCCTAGGGTLPLLDARHGTAWDVLAIVSRPTTDRRGSRAERCVVMEGGQSVGRSVQYWRDKSLRRAAALHGATQPVSEASERRSQQLRPPPVVVVVVVCLPPPTDDRHPPPSWRLEAAAAASAWKPGLAGALSLSLYINSLPQYTRRSSTSSCSLPSFYSCSTSDCQSSAEQKLVD